MNQNLDFRSGAIEASDPRDFNLGTAFLPERPADVFIPDMKWFKRHYQGQQPACGAFSGTHLAQILQHNDPTAEQVDLSPRNFWEEIKKIDGFPIDSGTSSRAIFKVLSSVGIGKYGCVNEDIYQSKEVFASYDISEQVKKEAHKRICGLYGFIGFPTFEQIIKSIQIKGGAELLLRGDNGFWGTLYPTFTVRDWGHFVCAFGWDKDGIWVVDSAERDDKFGFKHIDKKYFPSMFCVEVSSAFDVNDSFVQAMDQQIETYNKKVKLINQNV